MSARDSAREIVQRPIAQGIMPNPITTRITVSTRHDTIGYGADRLGCVAARLSLSDAASAWGESATDTWYARMTSGSTAHRLISAMATSVVTADPLCPRSAIRDTAPST